MWVTKFSAACADARGDRAAQAADGFAVVGELSQVDVVVRHLEAAGDGQPLRDVVFVLRERLRRLRDELLVEVRRQQIDKGAGIGRRLEAVGIGPFVPETGAENAPAAIPG